MLSVSIHEAKTQFSSLIARVEATGEHVVVCRHGLAVAEIVPRPARNRLKTDPRLRPIEIKGDLTAPTEGEWENV